jgi:hypothetical protein
MPYTEDICICKHPRYEHDRTVDVYFHVGCAGYIVAGEWCRCVKFKLDNLKYLEKQYEKTL